MKHAIAAQTATIETILPRAASYAGLVIDRLSNVVLDERYSAASGPCAQRDPVVCAGGISSVTRATCESPT